MIHGVTSLNELYNFSNLTEIILNNISLKNLDGIENCPYLNYICFKNYSNGGTIEDYSEISKLNNLVYLYLENTNENQKDTIFEEMKNVDYPELEYLGIYNSGNNITDISILNYLSQTTKESVTYLYLYSNNISDLSPIQDYKNIYELQVYSNTSLITLNGLKRMMNLHKLIASSCNLGAGEIYNSEQEEHGKNAESDALSYISDNRVLSYLDIKRNANLVWIDYIENKNFTDLYLSGCKNLAFESVKKIKDIYIDEKYLSLFNSSDRIDYLNLNLTNDSEEIQILYDNLDVKSLRLDGNNNLTDDTQGGQFMSLTEILSTCENLEVLSLRNITKINNISFVKNMKNLWN